MLPLHQRRVPLSFLSGQVFWNLLENLHYISDNGNAGFAEKNHIQICVCNPNCIKGYFLPREIDMKYPNP